MSKITAANLGGEEQHSERGADGRSGGARTTKSGAGTTCCSPTGAKFLVLKNNYSSSNLNLKVSETEKEGSWEGETKQPPVKVVLTIIK